MNPLHYDLRHRIRISGPDVAGTEIEVDAWYETLYARIDAELARTREVLSIMYPGYDIEVD